jgi:hypothetical protein
MALALKLDRIVPSRGNRDVHARSYGLHIHWNWSALHCDSHNRRFTLETGLAYLHSVANGTILIAEPERADAVFIPKAFEGNRLCGMVCCIASTFQIVFECCDKESWRNASASCAFSLKSRRNYYCSSLLRQCDPDSYSPQFGKFGVARFPEV